MQLIFLSHIFRLRQWNEQTKITQCTPEVNYLNEKEENNLQTPRC